MTSTLVRTPRFRQHLPRQGSSSVKKKRKPRGAKQIRWRNRKRAGWRTRRTKLLAERASAGNPSAL